MITESEQSRQSARIRHQRRLLVTGLFTISITSDTCNLDIEVYSITRRCRFIGPRWGIYYPDEKVKMHDWPLVAPVDATLRALLCRMIALEIPTKCFISFTSPDGL